MAEGLIADAVLLTRECKRRKSSSLEIGSGQCRGSKDMDPTQTETSRMRKSESRESLGFPMYSPGRSKKKWPRMRTAAAACAADVASRSASWTVCAKRVPGSGFTRDGGPSTLLHDW